MSVVFPETLVLSITLHGSMTTDDFMIEEFTIPSDMHVVKISAVAPGICNLMVEDDANVINSDIYRYYNSPALTLGNVERTLTDVIERLRQLETVNTIRQYPGAEASDYYRGIDTGFSVVKYDGTKPMIDKIFERSSKEGMSSINDYKITIINSPGRPDLFKLISKGHVGIETRASSQGELPTVTLSELVYYLRNKGVMNLVIFDFSCSQLDIDKRGERRLRRDAIRRGKNGGRKTLRRKHKTKTPSRKRKTRNGFSETRTLALPRH